MKGYSRLLRLTDACVSPDGETVGFRVETEDGELAVECPIVEIGDIFAFLGQLASDAAADKECRSDEILQNYLAPIPACGMGFAAGRTPEETLLVMRLPGLDLAFAVPSSGLAALADDIARMARTLSADPAQPQ